MTARHTQHWHGTRAVAGPVDEGGCCAGEAGWGAGAVCSQTYPHDPHFYVTAMAGGEPGPLPTATRICPGRTATEETA